MRGSAISFLRFLIGIDGHSVAPDGFGQSIADDIRFARNFRLCRRVAIAWRIPTTVEMRALDLDQLIGRFGELTIGLADVAGRRWIVRERDWHGWPDSPRFVFFAMEDSTVWAGADFDLWPSRWQWPPEWTKSGITL
ncbi:hypothetical protein [Glacieibacterium frigidum]|uniref:Uncharacterized protein n=1 Tax=Glacieibacterium frigidum TaxID=2593303 RepID=A0A552U874_9SPHN|nr:hypothetical protein [Glacieibacterium frigidum]TRW14412.1 hypothetical protein FMM06_11930 [Glacieibacterium frigidum]